MSEKITLAAEKRYLRNKAKKIRAEMKALQNLIKMRNRIDQMEDELYQLKNRVQYPVPSDKW